MSSIVAWIGLLIGLAAGLYAWTQSKTIDSMNRRLDRYNKALFDAGDEIRTLREELSTTAAQLRIEIKKNAGEAIFSPRMSVKDAQMAHPMAQQVMSNLRLGGCSTCADDSLDKAAHDHGVNLDVLLTNLNKLAVGQALDPIVMLKAPNVQLEID